MKRFAAIVLCLVFLLLAGCNNELTPIEKARDKAVSIGEQVLNYELSADEAYKQLDSLVIPEVEFKAGGSTLCTNTVRVYITSMKIAIRDNDYNKIQEAIDNLKELGD